MSRALFALLLPAAVLLGQGAPPASKDRGPKTELWQGEILARLQRMRTERLQQALGIPEEKAKAIAGRWERYDLDNRDLRQRMRQLHQQVNGVLFGPLPEDDKNTRIKPMVEQYTALRQQQQDLKRKFEDDIRGSLTPAQQGRFLLAVEEIQHALIEEIRKQRSASGGE